MWFTLFTVLFQLFQLWLLLAHSRHSFSTLHSTPFHSFTHSIINPIIKIDFFFFFF
eukprot:m.4866 g.4866  ORF g.4866 m.4866 type:complete len:56 (-) comp2302_c0_seq2:767-934(-)